MLMLSKKVEYGLIAVLHMADLAPGTVITAKDISEQFNIPGELLGKVLQALVRGGLVASVQGAHGGYRLARSLDGVQLGDVIEALEGPVFLTKCQEDPAQCGQFHTCTIKEPVHLLQEQLQQFIHGISLGAFRKTVRSPAGVAT
jgi:Rrf2 family protein